jgi:methyl-accepting chemotaxis protein
MPIMGRKTEKDDTQIKQKLEEKQKRPQKQKKLKKETNGKEVGMPLKFKSLIFVAAMIVLTAATTIFVALPTIRNIMGETTRNYMYDLAETNGRILDLEVYSYGVSVGLSEEKLEEMFQNVMVKGVSDSYAYIVTPDGNMCYHPKKEKIGKPVENEVISQVAADLQAGKDVESKIVSYEFKGETKYAAYYVNPNGCFLFVVTANEDDVMGTVDFVGKVMSVSAVIATLIGLAIAFIGFHFMFRPLRKIAGIVSRMGNLDFTRVPEIDKLRNSRDEMGLMARAVCSVQDQLRNAVTELQEQSRKLFQSSDSLSGNATVTAQTIGQINHAIHDMAEGASSQASDTQAATESVIVIGDMVKETNEEVARLRTNVESMHESGAEAVKTLKELESINAEVKESFEQIFEQTNTTNESAMKIQDAIELITSIAEETNLLSLNASIEAARAGEQGKGFAVVANQIQKLAEQSNESAMRVQHITNSLMEDAAKAVKTMDQVKSIMDSQVQKVDLTGSMFSKVQAEIDNSINGITKIYEKTEGMDSARVNVVDVVQSLTAIAQQNAAGTEETSASVQEVNQVIDDMSDNAKQLNSVAQTIDEHMRKFTV